MRVGCEVGRRMWVSVVLCLGAVVVHGTGASGALGVSGANEQAAGSENQCWEINGLPPDGPTIPWKEVAQKSSEDRKKWLDQNRDSKYNGVHCDPRYAMPHCKLLSKDWTSWLVQGVLATIGVLSLLLKKHREDKVAEQEERPVRTTKVWALDVSKQAFSGVCAHLIGIFNASTLQNEVEDRAGTSACSWYLIAFTLDTTFGVFFGYLMVRLCTYIGQNVPLVSALGETGNYRKGERDIDYCVWGQQLFVWCIITVIARMGVLGIMIWSKDPLSAVASVVAQEFACNPGALLWLVMLAGPVAMNVIQLWIQDQFLKDKQSRVHGDEQMRRLPVRHQAGVNSSHLQAPLLDGQPQPQANVDSDSSEDPYVNVAKAKELRERCCGCVLKLITCMFVVIPLLMFTGVLAEEQYYYDHCYTQVQNDAFRLKTFDGQAYSAKDWQPVPNCKPENLAGQGESNTLRWQMEHRYDLLDKHRCPEDNREACYMPTCRCCNERKPAMCNHTDDNNTTTTEPCINNTTGNYTQAAFCRANKERDGIICEGVGECCGRSTITNPDLALQQQCSICDIYLPCDTKRCAARPDYIRNVQHYPLALGVILSLLSNLYILHTWTFNSKLRRPTITSLICLAAAIELVYCVALLLQEVSFRIPNSPCVVETQVSKGGRDVIFGDCEPISQFYGWPSWDNVQTANHDEMLYRRSYNASKSYRRSNPGQRGQAVNYCKPMSFLFQLTWTASDSVYFMITVDLFLNLVSSPFGSSSKRWLYYHGITWSISFLFAFLLMYSDDWGVSQESVLEDFCWNVNFGHHSLIGDSEGTPASNWPALQITVYGVSGAYYVLSLLMAAFAQCKIRQGNLPEGLKEARLESIKIGTVVTTLCASWLLFVGVLYFIVMSTVQKSSITKMDTLTLGLRDYPKEQEDSIKPWVMVWAFVWGARNVINLVVWRYVIAQYSPKHAEMVVVPGSLSFALRAPPAQVRAMIQRIIEAEICQAPRLSLARPMQMPEAIEKRRKWLENLARERPDELNAIADRLGVQEAANLELNEVLRNELLFFAGLGIRSALRWPYHEHEEEQYAEREQRPDIMSRSGVSSASAWDTFHEELQGGGDGDGVSIYLADAERWEKQGGEHQGPTEFSKEVEQVFTSTHTRSSQHYDSGEEQELTESEKLRRIRANHERMEHLQKFRFKTYEPKKFRKLRELFGIDIRGGQGEDSELHKSMESFQVADFTGGASGAFMYFSADKRFIIKEINQKEMNRMLKMLDDYIDHLEKSRDGDGPPRSLLQRVVQCNRITMSEHNTCCGSCSGRLYFMVMENCLYPRIIRQMSKIHKADTQEELNDDSTKQLPAAQKAALLKKLELNDHANQRFFVYDLKGSRHGRSTLLDNGPREQQMRNTMKDNDLRENIHLSSRDREKVLKFLQKDSEFLEQQQVMDYSLLLGIQKGIRPIYKNDSLAGNPRTVAAATNPEHFAQAAALDGAETFYFGIIDFLQEWDGWKKAEAITKALLYGWDDISAVKPDLYQKRFVYRLGRYFPPEAELEIGDMEPEPAVVSRMESVSRCVEQQQTTASKY